MQCSPELDSQSESRLTWIRIQVNWIRNPVETGFDFGLSGSDFRVPGPLLEVSRAKGMSRGCRAGCGAMRRESRSEITLDYASPFSPSTETSEDHRLPRNSHSASHP